MSDTAAATAPVTDAGAQATTVVPTMLERVLETGIDKALTTAAVALAGYGCLPQAEEAHFVLIGSGILIWAANMGITWVIARVHDARLRAAVAAPAAVAVTK